MGDSHAENYIRQVVEQSGLEMQSAEKVVLRMEGHQQVSGLVVVARKNSM